MDLVIKQFNDLTTKELYELLKARAEIFVVEQNCVYQDLDDLDYISYHMFYMENDKVVAYARAFPKSDNTYQAGRILTLEHGKGLGVKLVSEVIKFLKQETNASKVYIEAQKYAIGFYQKFGFIVTSDEFLEDGIPHVKMELEL